MKWSSAWLNYNKKLDNKGVIELTKIISNDNSIVIQNAMKELKEAFLGLYNIALIEEKISSNKLHEDDKGAILLGLKKTDKEDTFLDESYQITYKKGNIEISSASEVGILYGVFSFLRNLQLGKSLQDMNLFEKPSNPLRMLNHWDNMDQSIERGYAGDSIFFQNNEIIINERTYDYARLCASIGINGIAINNVNVKDAATYLITDRYLDKLTILSSIFTSYGIKLFLSINFAAPVDMGELDTADPLDEKVIAWWRNKSSELFERIPDFGGYIVKADSEFRPGPFTYNRTHSDGANMLARALKPHGGILIWRCFVYNCKQDWRDRKTDRARAAYDHFAPLDGKFDDNVILQIKNGPMDFQVREAVSPLFGALKNTNVILEFQVTQEYTGQQKHVCYLVPMWKEVLDFNTYAKEEFAKVKDIVSGKTFPMKYSGITAVANVGNNYNWTGHDLALCNWYGFGRLLFNTELTGEEIANEWIQLTFGNEKKVIDIILKILKDSWATYEKYTSPLGIGWMVNPSHHYGPNIEGYEYSKWGTYHRADHKGIGVDRTTKGTGYTTQYLEANASMYENKETCPEELLLFFHYVSYDYMLKSGKTLIQHIYDTHFEGVEEVENMIEQWKQLDGLIDEGIYNRVSMRLEMQLESSIEWRDMVNTYFYRKSGIGDKLNRTIY